MITAALEMAAIGSDQTMKYLVDAAIRDSKSGKAACDVVSLLAIHCPSNGAGTRKLMSALSYLYQTGH